MVDRVAESGVYSYRAAAYLSGGPLVKKRGAVDVLKVVHTGEIIVVPIGKLVMGIVDCVILDVTW